MRDLRTKSKPHPSRLRGRGVEAALPLFYLEKWGKVCYYNTQIILSALIKIR